MQDLPRTSNQSTMDCYLLGCFAFLVLVMLCNALVIVGAESHEPCDVHAAMRRAVESQRMQPMVGLLEAALGARSDAVGVLEAAPQLATRIACRRVRRRRRSVAAPPLGVAWADQQLGTCLVLGLT